MEETVLTPRELLQSIKRRLLWILLSAVLAGILAVFLGRICWPPQYTATGSFYVYFPGGETADPATASAALSASQKLVRTCLVLLKSDRVLEQATSRMGPGYTPEDLRRMLSAVCLEETEALSISVTHEDPQTAMEMVNAILDTAPAKILRIVHTGGMEIIDRAGLPERPDAPSAWQNGVLGAFLGALVACLVSVWAGFGEKKRRLSRLRRRPGGRFSPHDEAIQASRPGSS